MLLTNHYHKPRKELGQNFLIDIAVIQQIITKINLQPDQIIIEIGPGLGAITKYIVDNCAKLITIEIDNNLCTKLTKQFSQAIIRQHLNIINQNVLTIDFISLIESNNLANDLDQDNKIRMVGNLPYNISTPLLFKLFSYASLIKDMHFLLQKEVAERLIADPDNKRYGRLSIMAQYHANMSIMFYVGAESFSPSPKVDSCFIRFVPHTSLPYKAHDYQHFYKLVTVAFSQRRKIISNALKSYCNADYLASLGIDPKCRPEQLSVADFVKISNELITLR